MFAAQVLTLGTGIVSIFVNNRALASIPVITNATVIGLMIYVIQALLERNFSYSLPARLLAHLPINASLSICFCPEADQQRIC